MRHWERLAVAVTAAVVIAFSSVTGLALIRLWRYPVILDIRAEPDGLSWRAGALSAELTVSNGAFERLAVSRIREDREPARP